MDSATDRGTINRETATGWSAWRTGRHTFVPAPVLSLAEYQAMSPHARGLHDLHRIATHASMPILTTPMSAAVSRRLWSRLLNNALKARPGTQSGIMINGGGYQGKTETACEVAAAFEEQWLEYCDFTNPNQIAGTRDLQATVAYVQTPVTATPKGICQAILNFYGAPHRGMTLPELVHQVRSSLHDHCTKALILDDITRLRLHRESDQDTLDLIRSLMSMQVTLVLIGVGIPESGLLDEGRTVAAASGHRRSGHSNTQASTQTRRRFDLLDLGPFRYDTPESINAWTAHLHAVETHLRLMRAIPQMLTGAAMPEYLFARTNGIVGLLERLIEDGCTAAIDTGTENLTIGLLDGVDIDLGNMKGRDPAAGEIPAVPARTPRQRRRNTVFDDRGAAAGST